MTAPLVLDARDISKSFGPTRALSAVSLSVEPFKSHGLVGRNGAGKSTLVSILTGLVAPDSGSILFGDEPAPSVSDGRAWQSKVACVYQRSTIVGNLSVAENLSLNRAGAGGRVSWKKRRHDAEALLQQWHIDVSPSAEASGLTVEHRQLVEIARALAKGARFVILDEPTAQLDRLATQRLFDRMHQLQSQGVTFLFISHHLYELYEVCEQVTVLKDGARVADAPLSETSMPALVSLMVGGDQLVAHPGIVRTDESASVRSIQNVLEVDELTIEPFAREITFRVAAGECVGIAGLATSGKAEVADSIVGMHPAPPGCIRLDGRKVVPSRPEKALAAGLGYVPRDRHQRGFAPQLSIEENITMGIGRRLGTAGFIKPSRRRAVARTLADQLDIVPRTLRQPVSALSGGNQQKVVMARALASQPKALVLIDPTAGVDIAAKHELYKTVRAACTAGTGVLLVSDEVEELDICDRVLVMYMGRITAELKAPWRPEDLVAAVEGVPATPAGPPTETTEVDHS